MFKKDDFVYGLVLGLVFPLIGLVIFKLTKFEPLSFADFFVYMFKEIGHRTLTVALSLSLLANALLFTIFVNAHKDRTAKGVFVTTLLYGVVILCVKFLG